MDQQAFAQTWGSEVHAEGWAEGLAAGLREARRDTLVRVLQLRFRGQVPSDILAAVRQQTDLDVLTRWFDAAVIAPSIELFVAMSRWEPILPR